MQATAQRLSAVNHPAASITHILRFSRIGSVYQLTPREFVSARTWYRAPVSTEPPTLAARIRQLAAERGYEDVQRYQDVPLKVRQELAALIASEVSSKPIQYVNNALGRGVQGGGRPERKISDSHRCPCCGQVFQTQLARNHAKEFLAKLLKSIE